MPMTASLSGPQDNQSWGVSKLRGSAAIGREPQGQSLKPASFLRNDHHPRIYSTLAIE